MTNSKSDSRVDINILFGFQLRTKTFPSEGVFTLKILKKFWLRTPNISLYVQSLILTNQFLCLLVCLFARLFVCFNQSDLA